MEAENFVLVEHKGYVTKVVELSDKQVDCLLDYLREYVSLSDKLGMSDSVETERKIIEAFEGRKMDVVLREP